MGEQRVCGNFGYRAAKHPRNYRRSGSRRAEYTYKYPLCENGIKRFEEKIESDRSDNLYTKQPSYICPHMKIFGFKAAISDEEHYKNEIFRHERHITDIIMQQYSQTHGYREHPGLDSVFEF